MKRFGWLLLAFLLFLSACQASKFPVTIIADGQTYTISNAQRNPADLLAEAGVTLRANDRLLYLGASIPLDTNLPEASAYTLTVRRAVALTVVTPDGTQTLQTSAPTVGQALAEVGFTLYAADRFEPPAETPILGPLTVTHMPSRQLTVSMAGRSLTIRSAAGTVGQALAEAGIPLEGLDYSLPAESAPLPDDGQVRVVRVVETITLSQKIIPNNSLTEFSADMDLDQEEIVQTGAPGLAILRVRVRSEDGTEVSRQTENESVIYPAQDQVVRYGTRVVMQTTTIDGDTITYWRAMPFYATSYHAEENFLLATGYRFGKGMVGIDPDYVPYGTQMYVPGYGYATAADTGLIIGRWIDLGYPDNAYVGWHRWVTVYFLWPPPAVIPYSIPPPITTWGLVPPPQP